MINKGLLGKFLVFALKAKGKGNAGVYHRLAVHGINEELRWDSYIGKDFDIGAPADHGTRAALTLFKRARSKLACRVALFKADGVQLVPVKGLHLHVLGGILRGARAKTVQTKRIFIRAALVVFVFAACVKLAENELPVVASLLLVESKGNTASAVIYFYGKIVKYGYGNDIAVPLACFVNRIREDLKKRMLTALKPVRAKNNARALSYTVSTL